jgi:hypothetical protein
MRFDEKSYACTEGFGISVKHSAASGVPHLLLPERQLKLALWLSQYIQLLRQALKFKKGRVVKFKEGTRMTSCDAHQLISRSPPLLFSLTSVIFTTCICFSIHAQNKSCDLISTSTFPVRCLGHHFSSSSSNRRMQTGPSSLQGETEELDTRIAVLALRRAPAWRSSTGLP